MFNILSSIERIIIAALIAVVGLLGFSIYNTNQELTSAKTVIKNQASKLESSELQVEYLTQSVEIAEEANAKLLKERASLARINEQHSKIIQVLNKKHLDAQQQITQLRDSTNEAVKKWASDCVPVSAIELLSHARAASCHKNSRANTVQIRNASNELN